MVSRKEIDPCVDEMRCLAKLRPRTCVLGKEFIINPEVFHPDSSCDITEFINVEVLKVVEGELMKMSEGTSFEFLEVGCGAGYTAILTALASLKCKVWATDINDNAVKNTVENAKLLGVDYRVKAVTADVFDNEDLAGRKFDMIYWNMPWFNETPGPGAELDMLTLSLYDPGYQGFRRFLLQAKSFLKRTGRIFVAFSFNVGSKQLFKRVVTETGWSYNISAKNIFLSGIADEQTEIEVSIVELFKVPREE